MKNLFQESLVEANVVKYLCNLAFEDKLPIMKNNKFPGSMVVSVDRKAIRHHIQGYPSAYIKYRPVEIVSWLQPRKLTIPSVNYDRSEQHWSDLSLQQKKYAGQTENFYFGSHFTLIDATAIPAKILQPVQDLLSIPQPPGSALELEIRVGRFTQNGQFFAGYPNSHQKVIAALLSSLYNRFTFLEKSLYLQSDYGNGVRQHCRDDRKEKLIIKKKLAQIDIETDRLFGLRVTVNQETPLTLNPKHKLYKRVRRGKPETVRVVQRKSFEERNMTQPSFRYDISKCSLPAPNKKMSADTDCVYHVEVELTAITDPQVSARAWLTRGLSLLGTSLLNPKTQQVTPLTFPELRLRKIRKFC